MVFYVDRKEEEMNNACPNMLFDRNVIDGRAMIYLVVLCPGRALFFSLFVQMEAPSELLVDFPGHFLFRVSSQKASHELVSSH